MRFLVVGSSLEAAQACHALLGVGGVEKVWQLPGRSSDLAVLSPRSGELPVASPLPERPVPRVTLRDVWGKLLLGQALEGYRTVCPGPQGWFPLPADRWQLLASGVSLVRCRREESGVEVQLSDGSELVCQGVLFVDGPQSRGRQLMASLKAPRVDRHAVACWTWVRDDILGAQGWEFVTALGKSVEQLPLPNGQVRVKLRFRSSYQARQTGSELRRLFSEFGPLVEGLLDGLDEAVFDCQVEQESPVTFSPLPGTLALGQAALGRPLLETFDWEQRLLAVQLQRVVESLLVDHWDPAAFEPVCQEALAPLLAAESAFRRGLHYDNALLRPWRDLVLRWMPAGWIMPRVKARLCW